MATAVASTPVTSPTQKLRDLIGLSECGFATTGELHNALFELESTLGVPFTTPDDEADYDEKEGA